MKEKHVTFINPKVENSFEELRKGKFESKKLFEFIERAIKDLKNNPCCGVRIQNKQVPKEYIKKFGIDNLWKYNLPNAWRLLYTIKGNDITILSVILEWLDHKNYERKFKY
ncbi:unnamed protein product [marine sediment metagenome]|uniref:Plasmid stabilization system protein n=1 Tax=marine sediment metagenome TaxID=412755 RepID=X0V721_9ZZZZ